MSISSCKNYFVVYPYTIEGSATIIYSLSDADAAQYDIDICDYFEDDSGFYFSPTKNSKEETDILFTFNKDLQDIPAYKGAFENQDTYSLYFYPICNYPDKVKLGFKEPWEYTLLFKIYDKESNLLITEEVTFVLPQDEGSGYVSTKWDSKILGTIPIVISYNTEYITH